MHNEREIFYRAEAAQRLQSRRGSPAIFGTAARWTRATQRSAPSPRGPTIRQLRRNLRQVQLKITQRYHALHEYARIYRALAAREAEGSERRLILVCLAEEADVRVERVEVSLRKFRIAHSLPAETRFRRLICWFRLRWRISRTLALLDRMESQRSRAMLEALTELSRLCRVIAAARVRSTQFPTRVSSRHLDPSVKSSACSHSKQPKENYEDHLCNISRSFSTFKSASYVVNCKRR
jgi:hypothetical protein